MTEQMIYLLEKQAWAQCQQTLACAQGDDPANRAWTNYLLAVGQLIESTQSYDAATGGE